MKVLVIGGTLFIGRPLVQSLVKAGHEVWILHRKSEHDFGKKVGNLRADRNDPAAVKQAIGEHRFEVVFDNVYDWQRGTTAAHIEATVKACGDHLKRYIFMSSVAAYGDGLNHHEGDALAPDDHPDPYVRNKAQSERLLFRMHQRYGTPVVTLRPPYIYGPGNPFYREAFFWDRLRDGRPIIIPGDGRRLMQFVYVKDLVWACLRAMEEPNAVGHAFNIANSRPLTQVEVVQAIGEAANKKPSLVRIPRERILALGGDPMKAPLYFGVYFDMPAITQVISKAQRVLKFKPTPFAEGLKETYRWYLRNKTRMLIDYSFEDRLLAQYQVAAHA
ncbi:MAG: SDR family oxidoreductase [Bryobacteraceae bacterium]|nr:SDR family oxidoreductase [Bryobacteraceae bacterium]MDW8379637.1 SDR family oxidoreductase [Bryobacterales bacterium]